jgi:hypothetical protein
MNLTQVFRDQLEREAARTRRALESVPKGKDDWAPHPTSMPPLRLAGLVASMPSWIALIINQDELELSPPAGQGQYQQPTIDGLVALSRWRARPIEPSKSSSNMSDSFQESDTFSPPYD